MHCSCAQFVEDWYMCCNKRRGCGLRGVSLILTPSVCGSPAWLHVASRHRAYAEERHARQPTPAIARAPILDATVCVCLPCCDSYHSESACPKCCHSVTLLRYGCLKPASGQHGDVVVVLQDIVPICAEVLHANGSPLDGDQSSATACWHSFRPARGRRPSGDCSTCLQSLPAAVLCLIRRC